MYIYIGAEFPLSNEERKSLLSTPIRFHPLFVSFFFLISKWNPIGIPSYGDKLIGEYANGRPLRQLLLLGVHKGQRNRSLPRSPRR